ncbi:MAG TPA: MraY family glycosyltransferase [Bacteroidales bacterium]|nr:MraY family glycosyltransferase [Bacteroidales bacterium]HSA44146.1 MraY family glycosyltransferase [Bacteroidales bacterium]
MSLLINNLLLKFSQTLGIRNKRDMVIRWSAESKPSLGGLTFYIIFLFSLSVYTVVFDESMQIRSIQFAGFLLAVTLGFLMGLYDDAYNTNVPIKLISQIGCGLILIATGTHIQLFDILLLDYLLTLLWVIGIMNSINMLDNMDAVTSLVSLGIAVNLMVSMILTDGITTPYSLVITGLIASLAGFLVFNWHPSRMFMGDTGSQFLGVLLAALSVRYLWNPPLIHEQASFFRPVILVLIVFAVPVIDTATVVIRRIARGRSPFVGGKDHTTHHLSYLGLSDTQVARFILAVSFSNCLLGVSILLYFNSWWWLPSLLYLAYFMTLFLSLFYLTGSTGNEHKG